VVKNPITNLNWSLVTYEHDSDVKSRVDWIRLIRLLDHKIALGSISLHYGDGTNDGMPAGKN
jgi:hypothetical protein